MAKGSAWKWGVALIGVPLAIGGVVVAGRWEPMQAASALPNAVARYKALGLPFTQDQLPLAHLNPEDNAASPLSRAVEALGKPSYAKDLDAALLTNDPALIRDALDPFQISLEEVPNIVSKKGLDFGRDWDKGNALLFPEFSKIKSLARVIAASARLNALQGKPDRALADLHNLFRITEMLNDEPTLISSLVEIAIHAIADRTFQEVLAVWRDNPGALERAEEQLKADKSRIDFLKSMKMEAYFGVSTLRNLKGYHPDRLKQTNSDGDMVSVEKAFEMEPVTRRTGLPENMMARAFMTRHLDYWSSFFEFAKGHPDDLRTLGYQLSVLSRGVEAQRATSFEVLKQLSPVFDQATDAFIKMEASRRVTAELARCMKTYAQTGRYPLMALSADPFGGKPLRIKVKGRDVRVYSVGPNLKDNGGLSRSEAQLPSNEGSYKFDDVIAQFPPLKVAARR